MPQKNSDFVALSRGAGYRVGFMQGRLSPMVGERIQSFPWHGWRAEFETAGKHDFHIMEWTLDQERLYENPLMTETGRTEIVSLSAEYSVGISSLTGDCFMQAPFWKTEGSERALLERDFRAVVDACSQVGIEKIVVPLVDNGRLENTAQRQALTMFLRDSSDFLKAREIKILFESDAKPFDLIEFLETLDTTLFGINYDMGNSAALGNDAKEEIAAYGSRILNVHVKDRLRGGTTVPLGQGNTDFDEVFAALAAANYTGPYILQTARAVDGDDVGALCRYRDMTIQWLTDNG